MLNVTRNVIEYVTNFFSYEESTIIPLRILLDFPNIDACDHRSIIFLYFIFFIIMRLRFEIRSKTSSLLFLSISLSFPFPLSFFDLPMSSELFESILYSVNLLIFFQHSPTNVHQLCCHHIVMSMILQSSRFNCKISLQKIFP